MVRSRRSSTTSLQTAIPLVLPVLVILATGVPHGRPRPASRLAVEVQAQGLGLPISTQPLGTSLPSISGIDQSSVQLSARGDLVRRQDSKGAGAGLVDLHSLADPAGITQDGAVTVVAPVTSQSEQLKLEELTEECMHDEPIAECMQKFGSYGIRKMFTESWNNIQKLEYPRPGWMSHPRVQKRKLFEVTLPGTVSSGSYAIIGEDATAAGGQPYGVVSQNLDFYQQLELGVRLFDIRVAYSSEAGLVYISHGALMIPLATALKDMRKFLEEHEREVIVLDVHKDTNADSLHLKPLLEEETANSRVPGQLVHEAVACEMEELLVNYKTLSKLPGNEVAENPTIGALTDLGARVVYFWHSQQVLCLSFDECKQTPGWHPPRREAGFLFAFGPPYEMGKRVNVTGGRSAAKMVEPACHSHSSFYTKDEQPEQLLKKMKFFVQDMKAKMLETRPACFPVGAALPDIHTPTIWYTLDAFVTPSDEEQAEQSDRMRGVKAIYTRGEGFTARTEAERTNYLMLSWFLKRNNQEQFTKSNGIMMEFVGAAAMSIIRIIEAEQGRPECGYAVYCKDSGSCWADTLLGKEDTCLPEADVLQKLKDHADAVTTESTWFLQITLCATAVVILFFCGTGISWYTRWLINHVNEKPKEAEQALVEDDLVSEPDSVPSEPEERPAPNPQRHESEYESEARGADNTKTALAQAPASSPATSSNSAKTPPSSSMPSSAASTSNPGTVPPSSSPERRPPSAPSAAPAPAQAAAANPATLSEASDEDAP